MRLLVAMMKHETNTFSPIPTSLDRFFEWGGHLGDDAYHAYKGTGMPFSAYIDVAETAGHQVITPIAAEAMPSGIVQAGAYNFMTKQILEAVQTGVDAALLDLHGAMVSEITDDGEGTLLYEMRKINPQLPIGVTYDLHANLTQKMVENCTCLIGYKTYPHIDMYEVGSQIANILLNSIDENYEPVICWARPPVLAQTLRMGHSDEPMKSILALTKEAEKDPEILAATVFGGFPLADFNDAGSSACIVAKHDTKLARDWCDRIVKQIWENRREFVYSGRVLSEALTYAKSLEDGPIILLDHADNVGSGGTQDVMTVIEEVIKAGLEDVAVAAVYDPEAVDLMTKAGIGQEISLNLGGKTDMPSINTKGQPLRIKGTVKSLTNG